MSRKRITQIFPFLLPIREWQRKQFCKISNYFDKNINIGENIQTGKVLILDDIYTTGRTLYHARDCLKEAFPGMQIESFSICR